MILNGRLNSGNLFHSIVLVDVTGVREKEGWQFCAKVFIWLAISNINIHSVWPYANLVLYIISIRETNSLTLKEFELKKKPQGKTLEI